jgi:hypothetical protein
MTDANTVSLKDFASQSRNRSIHQPLNYEPKSRDDCATCNLPNQEECLYIFLPE